MKAPNTAVDHETGARTGPLASAGSVARGVAYSLPDFLEDQRGLLELLGIEVPSSAAFRATMDGSPLIDVFARELLPETGKLRERYFGLRYGPTRAAARQERFFQVLRFVEIHAPEIAQNGFGELEPTVGIHAELLRHLLDFPVARDAAAIPSRALCCFYDEWGERWF